LGSLTKSQTFNLDWPTLGLIRVNREQTWGKRGSPESGVALHRFSVQILSIKLILTLNLKVFIKTKLSAPIGLNKALLEPNRKKTWGKSGSQG